VTTQHSHRRPRVTPAHECRAASPLVDVDAVPARAGSYRESAESLDAAGLRWVVIVGHSSLSTTAIDTHVTRELRDAAVHPINDLMPRT
jgi:hypothetical protein